MIFVSGWGDDWQPKPLVIAIAFFTILLAFSSIFLAIVLAVIAVPPYIMLIPTLVTGNAIIDIRNALFTVFCPDIVDRVLMATIASIGFKFAV
jgi:hypothetical protein